MMFVYTPCCKLPIDLSDEITTTNRIVRCMDCRERYLLRIIPSGKVYWGRIVSETWVKEMVTS